MLSQGGLANRKTSVAFSPDGARIVSGEGIFGITGELKVWDTSSVQESPQINRRGEESAIPASAPKYLSKIYSVNWR